MEDNLNSRSSLTEELCQLGQYMLSRQLAWGNSGNISARVSEHEMVITGSGTDMGQLAPTDLVSVNMESMTWQGELKPSKEVPMHSEIYKHRPEVNAVLHASPFWSTLMACSELAYESALFVESMYYLERVAYVDYYHPGSQALGQAVGEQCKSSNIIILRNHGVIVFDTSIKEARMALETLEMTSRMLITARMGNISLQALAADTAADFLDHSGYKPRRWS
jgi:ribulose-5-phosphate 4-epimerase/fuculose-1-phosphate aldolase